MNTENVMRVQLVRTDNGQQVWKQVKRSWFGSVGDAYHWTTNRIDIELKAALRKLANKRLESELADISRTASAHKKDKIAKGSPRYGVLWEIADQKVAAFCEQHKVARSYVEAQVPFLTELKDLATPPVIVPHQHAKQAGGGILGGALLIVALGVVCAIIRDLFLFGNQIPGWVGHGVHRLAHML